MTQKKKNVLAAVSGVVLLCAAGVLLAYFGAKDKESNMVGVGEDKIVVTEAFTQPNQEQDFKYRKLVKIKNTGEIPCYVRVRLEFSNSEVQNCASLSAANQGDADDAPADDTFKSAKIGQENDCYINNLPEGWVYVWDESTVSPDVTHGYYYYTKPVAPGESTDALISWVRMQYEDTSMIQAHDVYVYAESVQTVDANTGTEFTDWKNAWHSFAG